MLSCGIFNTVIVIVIKKNLINTEHILINYGRDGYNYKSTWKINKLFVTLLTSNIF